MDTNDEAKKEVKEESAEWTLSASEALYGFIGWLTSMENPIVFSSRHSAATPAELVDEFLKENKIEEPREGWNNHFTFPRTRPIRLMKISPSLDREDKIFD